VKLLIIAKKNKAEWNKRTRKAERKN